MYDISTMHTVDTEKGDAHINVLEPMQRKTLRQILRQRHTLT